MNKFYFFLLSFFFFSVSLFAQIGTAKRLEIEVQKKWGEDYKVLNLGTKGLLLLLESEENLKQSKREMIMTFYDTALNALWSKSLVVDRDRRLDKSCMESNDLYFLLKKQDYDYEIWRVDLINGDSEKIEYEKLTDFDITRFDVLNKVLILGGTVKSSPTVFLYDYKKGKAFKALQGIHGLKSVLNQLVAMPADSALALVLGNKNPAQPKIELFIYDNQGKPLRNWEILPEEDRYLLSYRPYFSNPNEMYLFGTYSLNNLGRAQGIYVGYFVGKEQQSMRYYDFSYLNNFFNHLGEKRKSKLFEKIKAKKAKEKVYQLDFSLFVKDLQINADRILLTVESYLPVYTDANLRMAGNPFQWNMNGYYNRLFYDRLLDNQPINRRPPLIYKYKHAAVCAFDLNGKLLWDNEFTYDDLDSPQPLAFLESSVETDSIKMLHLQGDKLYLKRAFKSQVVEKNIEYSIENPTGNELDKINTRQNEGLSFWYNKYFLLFGLQDIRQTQADNSFIKRKVFYLSKIYDNGVSPKEETDKKR